MRSTVNKGFPKSQDCHHTMQYTSLVKKKSHFNNEGASTTIKKTPQHVQRHHHSINHQHVLI